MRVHVRDTFINAYRPYGITVRKVQKNCLTLVVDVCNDTLDRFKGVMNAAIRRVGFGGA